MYPEIPMWSAILMLVVGLLGLAWSSDRFVDGSASLAKILGVSPFLIGMVIIGFGTSAPEMIVSALSGASGHSELSLGNAYGSCIFNIAFIIGLAAMIHPLRVKPKIAKVAAPILFLIAILAMVLLRSGSGFERMDGVLMLIAFGVVFTGYSAYDQMSKTPEEKAAEQGTGNPQFSLVMSIVWLLVGLVVMVASSHILVWGSVDIAKSFGVSELVIGLTIVAIGTSLPEVASAVQAARKGESELVLGNIVGSNMFNTLAVVGLAGSLAPFGNFSSYILSRDLPVLMALSLSIVIFGWSRKGEFGRIGRIKGALWLISFAVYFGVMLWQELK